MAEALLDLLPPYLREVLPSGVATLAALHDIGKVTPGFQAKCPAWLVREGVNLAQGWGGHQGDHARVSQYTVQGLLGASRLSRWAAVIGAHHGKVKGERIPEGTPWEEERRRLAAELVGCFGTLPDRTSDEAILWFTAGLIAVADWIGSNEDLFPQEVQCDLAERRRRARGALSTVGWSRAEFTSELNFNRLFPGMEPNSLQRAAMENICEPGVYVIEGPMGCGKTEAALVAAYRLIAGGKANGIYFALPTQITSNRIHDRVKQFLDQVAIGQPELRLAHSASWLIEDASVPSLRPTSPDSEGCSHVRSARSWFASSKKALLAPFGVGTVDQALLGVVAAKHFFIRQFGLAGKVVILDEVHSYDLYTGTLIDALIRRLRELKCTVIILSATLTEQRRRQLLGSAEDRPLSAAYPLLSGRSDAVFEVPCEPPAAKTVSVHFSKSSMIEEALARADLGQCVLWIRNTVDDAQETYRAIVSGSREGCPTIGLLHSRFPFFRREQLESHWMEALGKGAGRRPNGCVLVATQVVEQSVDIDADLLITDLAPTDMLLQRIGRLWRHDRAGRAGNPEVWIPDIELDLRRSSVEEILAAFGKSARIYTPYVLLRSLEQWRTRATITLPSEIRSILEATYAEATNEPKSWEELRKQMEERKRKLQANAEAVTRIWTLPPLDDRESVQTRYSSYPVERLLLATDVASSDSHSARISLPDGSQASPRDRDWSIEAAKAMHRNCVSVPRWAMAGAPKNPPGWLTNHVDHAAAVGILRDGQIRWLGQDADSGLSYHPDQGVVIRPAPRTRATREDLDESFD